MQRRIKGKPASSFVPPVQSQGDDHEITRLVEDIVEVLRRHDADANDGVLSLLTALIQSANQVMEASTPEDTEHNRAALISMLEHGRRFVDSWPQHTPHGWSVH